MKRGKDKLVRFGVAMEESLLAELDRAVDARGSSRSEAFRDLARGSELLGANRVFTWSSPPEAPEGGGPGLRAAEREPPQRPAASTRAARMGRHWA